MFLRFESQVQVSAIKKKKEHTTTTNSVINYNFYPTFYNKSFDTFFNRWVFLIEIYDKINERIQM